MAHMNSKQTLIILSYAKIWSSEPNIKKLEIRHSKVKMLAGGGKVHKDNFPFWSIWTNQTCPGE